MAAPSLLSPNVGNLRVGKGILSFKKTGDSEFRDVGEVKEFSTEMSIENLDHFTQRSGVKEKDFTVVLERGGTVRMVMEEWTPRNMANMLMGTLDEGAVGGPELTIYTEDAIEGALQFVSTNDVGPKIRLTLEKVRFVPDSTIDWLSEEWGPLELVGEMLKHETNGFGTAKWTNIGSET